MTEAYMTHKTTVTLGLPRQATTIFSPEICGESLHAASMYDAVHTWVWWSMPTPPHHR